MKNAIINALTAANVSYIARTPAEKQNLTKTGIQKDIARAMGIANNISDAQASAIKALEVEDRIMSGINGATNTKKPMRTLEAVLFSITGDGRFLKGSAKTFILEFCGLVIAQPKTRAGLAFCATGKGNESTSDEVKVSQARKIIKAFGEIGVSTESTQNSVSFSKGGIADVLGIARKDSRTGLPVVNLENKVAQKLDEIVKGMTDGKLALLVAQSKGK